MSLAREMAEAAKERRKRMGFVETKPVVLISRPLIAPPVNEDDQETQMSGRRRPGWPERQEITRINVERKRENARLLALITQSVCAHFNVKFEDIRQYRRSINNRLHSPHAFSIPQYVAFWLCNREFNITFKEIGRYFSRDHSTVMYGVARMEDIIKQNPAIALSVFFLRAKIEFPDRSQIYWGA